jgi:hypothetical protein
MPFKSEAQRKFLWAKHPEIAERWTREYPNKKKLPEHVGGFLSNLKKKKAKKTK